MRYLVLVWVCCSWGLLIHWYWNRNREDGVDCQLKNIIDIVVCAVEWG